MCLPLFALAFCSVFGPTAAPSAAPSAAPAAVQTAGAAQQAPSASQRATAPAWEGEPAATKLDRASSHDGPDGARADAAVVVASEGQAARRELVGDRSGADTEAKSGADSPDAASAPRDTEPK